MDNTTAYNFYDARVIFRSLAGIGVFCKVAALSAGPYAYMVTVLGFITEESCAWGKWWALLSYVIGSAMFATVAYMTVKRVLVEKTRIIVERDSLERHCMTYGFNLVRTVAITILIMHVVGPYEEFTVVVSIITFLVQQSLSYKNMSRSAGYLHATIILILWATPQDNFVGEGSARYTCLIKDETIVDVNAFSMYVLCVLLGFVTQADVTQIVNPSQVFFGNKRGFVYFAMTFGLHVLCLVPSVLWPIITASSQTFYSRVCATGNTGYFRLILSITSLILSTASENPNSVYQIMSGETAAICATIIFVINFPTYATIDIFYSAAVIVVVLLLYRLWTEAGLLGD